MRAQRIACLFFFAAVAAYGQTVARKPFDAAETFVLSNQTRPSQFQAIVQILKSAMDFVNVDSAAPSVTVHGSPEKLAMTGWLLRELDRPVLNAASLHMDEYAVSLALQKELAPLVPAPQDASNQVMDVFFLAHTDERGIQVLLATLRLVGYVRKVVNDSSLKVLVVRGSESQMAVAKYLVGALDITQAPSTAPPGIQLRSPTGSTELVRIFYLAYANSQAAEQQIMAALRNVLEVKSVFNFYVPPAIAVRGSADEMSAAQWLVQSLDIAPDPKSPPPVAREFHVTGIAREDNVVGVFYSPKSKPGSLTASAIDNPQALVVRGSAGQIAAAEQLMQ